jgi:hypothetical protein
VQATILQGVRSIQRPRRLPSALLMHDTDRTSELRKKGFEGRRLGPKQMTTDTAVRVTRLIVHNKSEQFRREGKAWLTCCIVPLEQIAYVDYPELKINKNESTEMPFRYVKGKSGEPIMPEVCYIAAASPRLFDSKLMLERCRA